MVLIAFLNIAGHYSGLICYWRYVTEQWAMLMVVKMMEWNGEQRDHSASGITFFSYCNFQIFTLDFF